MRRLRYWLAWKLVPELAIYAKPTSSLAARLTLDLLHSECRWIDPETRGALQAISGVRARVVPVPDEAE